MTTSTSDTQRPHLRLTTTSHTLPPGDCHISLPTDTSNIPPLEPSSLSPSLSPSPPPSPSQFLSYNIEESSSHNLVEARHSPSSNPPSASSSTSSSSPIAMFYPPPLEVSPQPFVCTADDEFSPTQRERRAPSPANAPPLRIESSPSSHTINVQLPKDIRHEMVTISVLKGDKLKVIADAWHMEANCHYEWMISFHPHDIDMTGVHANFDADGHLAIDVRRRPHYHA